MPRRNNNLIFGAFAVILIIFVLNYVYNKKKEVSNYASMQDINNFDFIEQADTKGDFEFIDESIGIGTGPGLWGSGRHTSEFVGN